MTDGSNSVAKIPVEELWDDYYTCLHNAYNALREAFDESGLTQDELAMRLEVDKSLISKRLNGSENLTVKTMSHMGTGMGRYLMFSYLPYGYVGMTNNYSITPSHSTGTSSSMMASDVTVTGTVGLGTPTLGLGTPTFAATGTANKANILSVPARAVGR